MGLNSKEIIGVSITIDNETKVLEEVRKYLDKSKIRSASWRTKSIKPLVIFTPNPEIIVYAQKDPVFKRIVNSAQINIPDGAGVAFAFKKLYGITLRSIPGIDMMKNLCREAEEKGLTIGVIGGRGQLANVAAECLREAYPKLKIEVLGEPEIIISNFEFRILNMGNTEKYFNELIRRINDKKIDILFVALGFPKQEYFINQLAGFQIGRFSERPLVMMGVGGSLDYISKSISRAPVWMRERGLEWLFRLLQQPWRIKRHIVGSEFFLQVLFNRKSNSTIHLKSNLPI